MKFILVTLAVIAAASAQQYQQQPIAILRQNQDVSPDGSYNFNYETENGIKVSEQGQPGAPTDEGAAVNVQGSYTYTAPDGTPITVNYRADENGYFAEGDHLPVGPAIPEAIQRSIQYNLDHPEASEQHTQQTYRRAF